MNDFSNQFYFSASDFFKKKFGCKVYKLSINAGCTCPNRDGTKGYGGCIFCNETGSGDFASAAELSVTEQLTEARNLVAAKCKKGKYLAYFQNFTNTYGNISLLEKKWTEAAGFTDVAGVSIATRPDCISEEVLQALKRLSGKTFVMIELGLQTSNDYVGNLINRKYSSQDFIQAVLRIKEVCPEIHITAHLIFGLPEETERNMLDSVDFLVRNKVDGIKISLLHVLKGTALLKLYEENAFRCLEMEEYFQILSKAIVRIPSDIVIHRVTGDGSKRNLVAPLWTADKKKVLNSMNRFFKENEIYQGRDYREERV